MISPTSECPGYDSKLYLMVRVQSWNLGNVKNLITITPRFTLNPE